MSTMKTITPDAGDDVFTEEDQEVYSQSIRELQNGEAISLGKAKKELLRV